jgi:hypothetical protein
MAVAVCSPSSPGREDAPISMRRSVRGKENPSILCASASCLGARSAVPKAIAQTAVGTGNRLLLICTPPLANTIAINGLSERGDNHIRNAQEGTSAPREDWRSGN